MANWIEKLGDPEQFKEEGDLDQALIDEAEQYLRALPLHKLMWIHALTLREALIRMDKWK